MQPELRLCSSRGFLQLFMAPSSLCGPAALALVNAAGGRYNGVWKTRTPSSPSPSTVGYWEAVRRLETALQDRGHVVYDGHIAHCPEKVRATSYWQHWQITVLDVALVAAE